MFLLYLDQSYQRYIPDPEFGDVITLGLNRINRRTRGNDLIIRDVGHINKYMRRYTWMNLCDPDFDWLEGFVKRAVGEEVVIVDHNGDQFDAILQNPDTELSTPSRTTRSVTLDFLVTDQ